MQLGSTPYPALLTDCDPYICCTCLSAIPSHCLHGVSMQVNDVNTVIPRNSVIEANQSGLIAEPLVDITPQLPIPEFTANPMDPRCEQEAAIVCHNGRIQGQQVRALLQLSVASQHWQGLLFACFWGQR